jgi:hypothetical protein
MGDTQETNTTVTTVKLDALASSAPLRGKKKDKGFKRTV